MVFLKFCFLSEALFGTDEPFFNGLVSMDASDFLWGSDQKMFMEPRFSCQNIISFKIIRENHIFSSPELREKIFENRRKSGNTQGKLICKTAMNPEIGES